MKQWKKDKTKMIKNIGITVFSGMLILSGCGSKLNTELTNEAQVSTLHTEEQEISEDITNVIETEAVVPETYAYEQELQVIDDNVRNYYEIFVYSFYDSDGDGIGDLNGVTEKLDYLQEMGFNGIWLMPVFESTTYHKYDVVDYEKIDPEYGTNEDLARLVEECHKRGIRIILDFVINHTSSQNPWFIEAKDYLRNLEDGQEPDPKECPYFEYYHFSNEQVNGTYYAVPGTNWYYEGSFWSEMPDLNLSNEELRNDIEKIADQWIEVGVDGFRMDATLHFEEGDTSFNTETMNWLYEHCLEKNPDFYMVSEVWANESTIADYYESKTPSMFNFDVADAEGKLIKAARGNYKAAKLVNDMVKYQTDFAEKNEAYIDAPFITNHDMGRVANVLQSDVTNLKMASALLMTMNGSPFVYYGEEIGMKSGGNKDENKRLPMIWSTKETTGMTNGPKEADKSIQSDFLGVEEQWEDAESLLRFYQRGLRIRNENPEIGRGTIEIVENLTNDHIAVITKTYEGSTIAICYNTGTEDCIIPMTGKIEEMGIRGYLSAEGQEPVLENRELQIPKKTIVILK